MTSLSSPDEAGVRCSSLRV